MVAINALPELQLVRFCARLKCSLNGTVNLGVAALESFCSPATTTTNETAPLALHHNIPSDRKHHGGRSQGCAVQDGPSRRSCTYNSRETAPPIAPPLCSSRIYGKKIRVQMRLTMDSGRN